MAKIDDIETMGSADAPDAIYDATTLGVPKMVLFGLQHMFAMFGATVLVPVLTGLPVPSPSSRAMRPSPPTASPSCCATPASASLPPAASTSCSPPSSRPSAPSAS